MPKPKRYRLYCEFSSEEDMKEWAAGTTKRPYKIAKADALDTASGVATIKRYKIVQFLDEDAPNLEDLHPVVQGIRLSKMFD
jgi:hypothetical protein|tara:strand:+ start:1613 stop:1858 length:246 start_codon:yes stop_codon:yes gene_type:complete